MQSTYSIMLTRQSQSQDSHAIGWTPAVIFARYFHKLVAVQSELSPVGTKILVHQFIVESVIARGDRCMGREERVGSYHLACFVKAQTGGNKLTAAFQV